MIYPEDPNYEDVISAFINQFSILPRMLDSKSDFKQFEEPFKLVQSLPLYCFYDKKLHSKRTIVFQ